MLGLLNVLFHLFGQLPSSTQAILLVGCFGGFFGLFGLVALYPPAGTRIVAFLAALLALAHRHKRKPRRRPGRHTPRPTADHDSP